MFFVLPQDSRTCHRVQMVQGRAVVLTTSEHNLSTSPYNFVIYNVLSLLSKFMFSVRMHSHCRDTCFLWVAGQKHQRVYLKQTNKPTPHPPAPACLNLSKLRTGMCTTQGSQDWQNWWNEYALKVGRLLDWLTGHVLHSSAMAAFTLEKLKTSSCSDLWAWIAQQPVWLWRPGAFLESSWSPVTSESQRSRIWMSVKNAAAAVVAVT